MELDAVELLARAGDVKAWREGTDLHISVPAEAPEEDFKRIIAVMGLEGVTDYEVHYIPETGEEIIYVQALPRQRGWDLTPRVSTLAGYGIGIMGGDGVLALLLRHFG